jgi:hypothetical protein
MAKYRVTSPDGTSYEVTAPDDASESQVLEYAKTQFAQSSNASPQQRDYSKITRDDFNKLTTAERDQYYKETSKRHMKNGWGTGIPKLAYDVGGQVTDATGSPAAGFAANVATQAVPSLLSSFNIGQAPASVTEKPASFLMSSALKPTVEQWRTGKAARAIETMLKEGKTPTKGGVDALKTEIAKLNDEISTSIASSNATVDKNVVASYLQDAVNKFERQVSPGADVKAIQSAWDEFLAHPLLTGKDIPVQLAQQMKQGTYKVLGEKAFGEQKGAAAEAQKTLARGLKEEISKAVPKVADMNKREGDLINAMKLAERRVNMDANKNPLGLGALLSTPWMLPVWMWDRSPGLKAATGIALHNLGRPDIMTPLGVAGSTAAGNIAPWMSLQRQPGE